MTTGPHHDVDKRSTQPSTRRALLLRRAELARQIADVDERLAALEVDAPATSEPADYSTHRLPPDCPHAAAFHRACRSGRVEGARKIGRAWTCTAAAWAARAPAPPPRLSAEAKTRARVERRQRRDERAEARAHGVVRNGSDNSDDVLGELGLVRVHRRSA